MALFPIPPTTFEILKGGFNPPTPFVITDALTASRQIRNQQECLFFTSLPIGTQIGLNLLLLPQTNWAIKPLSRLVHEIRDWTSGLQATQPRPMLTGMVSTNSEEIMPAILLTELHHGKTPEGTIPNQRTLCFSQMRYQALEQLFNTLP